MTRLQKDALRELAIILFLGIMFFPPKNPACFAALSVAMALLLLFLRKYSGGPVALEPGPLTEPKHPLLERCLLLLAVGMAITLVSLKFRGAPIHILAQVAPFLLVFLLVLLWLSGAWKRGPLVRPQYDEREHLVKTQAENLAYGLFFSAFFLWNMAGWILTNKGASNLPTMGYRVQLFIALAIVSITRSLSILWQEWRAGESGVPQGILYRDSA